MRGLGGTRVGMGYGVGRLLVPHRGTGPGTCPPLGPIMDLFPIMDISQLWIFLNSGIMDLFPDLGLWIYSRLWYDYARLWYDYARLWYD